ncbi:MAG TPA: T9SS type A sorting domain-containing protein [Saprospiraceae bacterium]
MQSTAVADPKSNDWIFLQRSFPAGKIDPSSYKSARTYRQQKVESLLERQLSTNWEFCGPTNVGGRITDVEILQTQPTTFYAGAASGGVFKSEDSGMSWEPIFDNQLALSIGDIAIAPSNEDIIYVGTGEPNAGGGSIAYDGYGVYRSNNGGETWNHSGLEEIGSVSKIIVHPDNPEKVYAAGMGNLFSNGPERGLFRTTDGGENWEKVLFINDSTGIIDLVIHPVNPDILYAAAWQRVRRADKRAYGGPSSGIYKSIDGGNSWQELTNGLPGEAGRIGITISPSNPNILHAVYEDENTSYLKGIFSSHDNGNSWQSRNTSDIYDPPYMYWFGKIVAHPVDTSTLYLASLDMYKSTNGGMNWFTVFSGVHLDQHALAFHPNDPEIVLIGNDGGVYLSPDGGNNFDHLNTLPITQFYTCEIDHSVPKRLYGGAQDNGTVRTVTGKTNDWRNIYGGDGFRVRVDPDNNQFMYAEYQYGAFGRSTSAGEWFDDATTGINQGDRFNWHTPYILDPANPAILYLGSHRLYKSTNRAQSWLSISPDLTKNNSSTGFNEGTITSISASPINGQILFVGTDNGNVQVSSDGGNSWTLVSENLPHRWVTSVVVDPFDQNTAYVTFSGYRFGESVSHIFKTIDLGQTWFDISGDLPDMPVNCLIVTPVLGHLYIATDIGVLNSTDDGLHWELVGNGMPNLVITDLTYHAPENLLVAATYGRGMYKITPEDEITSVQTIGSANTMNLMAYPNPFQEQVTIECIVPARQEYTIDIIDLEGRVLKSIHQGELSEGLFSFKVNAVNIPTGIYFCRVTCQHPSYNSIIRLSRN